MVPPASNSGTDSVFWGLTSDGAFTTKSAYLSHNPISISVEANDWKRLWQWTGPFKVSNFLWRMLNNGLWLNHRRRQAHMTVDASCPLCHAAEETTLHSFRDCAQIQPLWSQIVDVTKQQQFFSASVRDWVLGNLDDSALLELGQNRIRPRFGLLLWSLWKQRANHIFRGLPLDLRGVFNSALKLHLDFLQCSAPLTNSLQSPRQYFHQINIRWDPPPASWVKCNVDGSVVGNHKAASCGGACRDEDGQWVFGFGRNLGSSNVLWSELWAILSGLSLSWDRGHRKVLLESDSQVAVHLITHGCDRSHPYNSMVHRIQAWFQRSWEVRCVHVHREANQVADSLAGYSHSLAHGIHLFETPPPVCSNALLFDRLGVSFPRSIRV